MTEPATPLSNAHQGGAFLYIYVMAYTKLPIPIIDQIAMLKSRGLAFADELMPLIRGPIPPLQVISSIGYRINWVAPLLTHKKVVPQAFYHQGLRNWLYG